MSYKKRFWSKVKKDGPTQPHMKTCCWIWTGGASKLGYGRINIEGKIRLAHRISFRLANGDAGNAVVMHRCDNPPCVRPSHLRAGTRSQNNKDMTRKRRVAAEENHGHAKLTRVQVIAIRDEYARGGISQKALGQKYGIWQGAVSAITRRALWRHV